MKIRYMFILIFLVVGLYLLYPKSHNIDYEVIIVNELPEESKNVYKITIPINNNLELIDVGSEEDDKYVAIFNLYNINRNMVNKSFAFETNFLFELVDYKIDDKKIVYYSNDLYKSSEINELLDLLSFTLKLYGINDVELVVNGKTYKKS